MKKIYLLLMALLVSCLYTPQAQADEVTVNFADQTSPSLFNGSTWSLTSTPGISLYFASGAQYATGTLKIYGSKTVKISLSDGQKMTKIIFDGYKSVRKHAKLSSGGGSFDTSTHTWTNADGSTEVVFTSTATSTSQGFTFTGLTITYAGGGGDNTPSLTVDPTQLELVYTDFTTPVTGKINVKGANLTADVTASCDNTGVTFIQNTCTAAQAQTEDGFDFEFSYTPQNAEDTPTITFTSGTQTKEVKTSLIKSCSNLKELSEISAGTKAVYTGTDAVVSYNNYRTFYVQDATAAMSITSSSALSADIKEGAQITSLTVNRTAEKFNFVNATVGSQDNIVTPLEVTTAQLQDEAFRAANLYRLIVVKYGQFAESGVKLSSSAPVQFNVDGLDVPVYVYDENGAFYSYTTPAGLCSVTGILNQASYTVTEGATTTVETAAVYPRTASDIVEVVEADKIPKLTIAENSVAVCAGTSETALSTSFNLTGVNLSNPVTVTVAPEGLVTFPKAELATADFTTNPVAVAVNWVPKNLTEGVSGTISVATSVTGTNGTVVPVTATVTLKVLGAPTLTATCDAPAVQDMPIAKIVKVSGTNLVGNITVNCPEGITATPATITPVNNAVAETEVTLLVDLQTVPSNAISVSLTTDGLEEPVYVTLNLKDAVPLQRAATLAEVRAVQAYGKKVLYTGNAVVTYSSDGGCYMQDETAGIYVNETNLIDGSVLAVPAQGDKITQLMLEGYTAFESTGWQLKSNTNVNDGSTYTVVETDVTVEPKVLGADELDAKYADMLVRVVESKLTAPAEQTDFKVDNTYPAVSPTGHYNVSPLAGDLAGSAIPTNWVDVTGIYTTLTADSRAVRPRAQSDITESGNQKPLVALITPSYAEYAKTVQEANTNVNMGSFTCEFINLPEKSVAHVSYEQVGAGIKLNKSDAEASEATSTYALTDGTYTLNLESTPEVGYYQNIKVTFAFPGYADKSQTFEFEPLRVKGTENPAATMTNTDGQDLTSLKLVQENNNEVSQTFKVTLANCYEPVVVLNPVQHPFDITENTMILSLANAEQPVQPTALEDGDSDAEQAPLVLYPGEGGNGEYNLKLTMHCQYKFDTAEPLKYTFVRQGDPNQQPLATLTVNYEANDVQTDIEGVEAASELYRVYSLQGILLLDGVRAERVAELPAGLYIVNGKKVYIRK